MLDRYRSLSFSSITTRQFALIVPVYLTAYLVLDRISYIHGIASLNITPWNPPAGLSLALLLAGGPRFAPLVYLAVIIADILLRGTPAPVMATVISPAVIAGGYCIAAHLLRSKLRVDLSLQRQGDLFSLVLVTATASMVVALLYVVIFAASGLIPWQRFTAAAFRFWVGDVIGILVLTPVLTMLPRLSVPRNGLGEIACQGLSIGGMLWIVFGQPAFDGSMLFYLLFLPLIWIAVRHGIIGAALGALATQGGLILAIELTEHETASVIQFQLLMLALTVTSLFLGVVVSERRRAEAKLREHQAQLAHVSRLSMAGELAATLAHELNQPLAAIVNYTRAAQRLLRATPEAERLDTVQGALDKAVAQADRAAQIIKRLRSFLRKGENRPAPTLIGDILADVLDLARADAVQQAVELRIELSHPLPPVRADKIQIEQVVLNLMRNSMEALADTPQPRRFIIFSAAAAGDVVEIAVSDGGPGIAPEIEDLLFTPLATTKAEGMGLGLSIARSIVEAHGGRLWAEPRAGGGAVFRFTLPIAAGENRHV